MALGVLVPLKLGHVFDLRVSFGEELPLGPTSLAHDRGLTQMVAGQFTAAERDLRTAITLKRKADGGDSDKGSDESAAAKADGGKGDDDQGTDEAAKTDGGKGDDDGTSEESGDGGMHAARDGGAHHGHGHGDGGQD